MMMPDASASLIPDHDDSGTYVNHDKDFAPPPNKLKGEEEDNTPTVVPMSQDSGEEDNICFRKSQDSDSDLEEEEEEEPPYTEEEARHAFELWRQMFLLKEYADQSEHEKRFKFFKDSLYRKVTPLWKRYAFNRMDLADQTPQEAARLSQYCSITINQIHEGYEDFKVHMSWQI